MPINKENESFSKYKSKSQVRDYIKAVKKSLTSEQISDKSHIIIDNLMSTKEYKNNDNILTYVNYNQEVVTKELINMSLQAGKNVYVPKVYGKDMKFHQIKSLDELKPGKYGILEPDNECVVDAGGFMIMPGLAFSEKLDRIGYGGGFYDRYLENRDDIFKCAVAFDCQILNQIPNETFDLRPDMLITETKMIYRN